MTVADAEHCDSEPAADATDSCLACEALHDGSFGKGIFCCVACEVIMSPRDEAPRPPQTPVNVPGGASPDMGTPIVVRIDGALQPTNSATPMLVSRAPYQVAAVAMWYGNAIGMPVARVRNQHGEESSDSDFSDEDDEDDSGGDAGRALDEVACQVCARPLGTVCFSGRFCSSVCAKVKRFAPGKISPVASPVVEEVGTDEVLTDSEETCASAAEQRTGHQVTALKSELRVDDFDGVVTGKTVIGDAVIDDDVDDDAVTTLDTVIGDAAIDDDDVDGDGIITADAMIGDAAPESVSPPSGANKENAASTDDDKGEADEETESTVIMDEDNQQQSGDSQKLAATIKSDSQASIVNCITGISFVTSPGNTSLSEHSAHNEARAPTMPSMFADLFARCARLADVAGFAAGGQHRVAALARSAAILTAGDSAAASIGALEGSR